MNRRGVHHGRTAARVRNALAYTLPMAAAIAIAGVVSAQAAGSATELGTAANQEASVLGRRSSSLSDMVGWVAHVGTASTDSVKTRQPAYPRVDPAIPPAS